MLLINLYLGLITAINNIHIYTRVYQITNDASRCKVIDTKVLIRCVHRCIIYMPLIRCVYR